ncbi:MAG TPA: hypothetical protein DIW31_08850 [Bacteroidales bacterium]|nr:hypothetical protein [Bacteroidales bacterium]
MSEESQENKITVDQSIELLLSSSHGIGSCWNDFIQEEYGDKYAENREDLIDIITIVDYIVSNLKEGKTDDFRSIFAAIEQILETGDDASRELMVVGIIEGLQNNCGLENIEYHTTFDQWLQPKAKKTWDGLIYLWESNDSIEEKQEKLKDYRI